MLRPGTHVLRRSATELQVGLDPRRAVVLPDRPEVRALLDALSSPATARRESEYDGRTLALLADSGLLVDADLLLPLAPLGPSRARASAPLVSRADVAALAAEAGDRVGDLLRARAQALVEVITCGSPEADAVATSVAAMLCEAGVEAHLVPRGQRPGEPGETALTGLLVAVGEPPREVVDDWMRTATPHLLLRLAEGHALVGPFVLPGETACLRCMDAHMTDVDPAWPLLVTQYASAVTRVREDTMPEPVDALLAALACAWVAREIVSHAEGGSPATTSTTVSLDPRLTALETHCWPRHPECGCTWT